MPTQTLIFSSDNYQMNWFRPDFPYAELQLPQTLQGSVENRKDGDRLYTVITLTNPSSRPVMTCASEIAISFPLEDRYESSAVCMRSRCHAHMFCGGSASYINALRMGGEPPHLGMVLTEGALSSYSIQRNTAQSSNDRGCFWLHPAPMEFGPHESKRVSWVVFPHSGGKDFWMQAAKYARCIQVQSSKYVLFPGEQCEITVQPSFPVQCVTVDGAPLTPQDGTYRFRYTANEPGEHVFRVQADEMDTWCCVFVHTDITALAEKRCQFIAERQQYHGTASSLQGAYLAYDNEENHQLYRPVNDYNGGRERVGMALLISKYLQIAGRANHEELEHSLLEYVAFVERELLAPETGRVYNDIGRDLSYLRQYNFPWYALLYVELYNLYRNPAYILQAYRILNVFYDEGGDHFYPIELPIAVVYDALCAENLSEEADNVRQWAVRHAENLLQIGTAYPPHEVNYEQSIVAPTVDVLLKAYQITKDKRYLDGAKIQLKVLELFNGHQPDYHRNETAIRHWDGYWFGKYQLYGDTFPHYWSALTGLIFMQYATATGEAAYLRRAQNSLRGVLPLIFGDGRASCAYVFPNSVNGTRAGFYDPLANDQDWGLYFYLRTYGLASSSNNV